MEQGFIFIRQSFGAATGEHVERKMPFFFLFFFCFASVIFLREAAMWKQVLLF